MRFFLTPRMLGAHLLGLVCVGIAIGLGNWQLAAWQAHRDAEAVDLTHEEPVELSSVMGPDDPFPAKDVGRPVDVAGTWVPDGTVYVSGREVDGEDGYWVVTPVAIGDGADARTEPALPVVRGWIADPEQAPASPTGEATVVGWLQPTEGTGASDDDPTDDILPQVRTADLIQHVDQDLYGAYAVADHDRTDAQEGTDGLAPATLEQLPKASGSTGLRNLLYAIEWWVFGLFAAYIWYRFVRDQWEIEKNGGPDADSDAHDGPDAGHTDPGSAADRGRPVADHSVASES